MACISFVMAKLKASIRRTLSLQKENPAYSAGLNEYRATSKCFSLNLIGAYKVKRCQILLWLHSLIRMYMSQSPILGIKGPMQTIGP